MQAASWAKLAIGVAELYPERSSCRFLPAYFEGPYDVLRAAYAGLGELSLAEAATVRCYERKAEREASMKGAHDANFSMPIRGAQAGAGGCMRPEVPKE